MAVFVCWFVVCFECLFACVVYCIVVVLHDDVLFVGQWGVSMVCCGAVTVVIA